MSFFLIMGEYFCRGKSTFTFPGFLSNRPVSGVSVPIWRRAAASPGVLVCCVCHPQASGTRVPEGGGSWERGGKRGLKSGEATKVVSFRRRGIEDSEFRKINSGARHPAGRGGGVGGVVSGLGTGELAGAAGGGRALEGTGWCPGGKGLLGLSLRRVVWWPSVLGGVEPWGPCGVWGPRTWGAVGGRA